MSRIRSKDTSLELRVRNATGGPMYYTGRDMKLTHEGMGISESDWSLFTGHMAASLDNLSVGEPAVVYKMG